MSLLLPTVSRCSKHVILGVHNFQFSVPIVKGLIDVTFITHSRRKPNVTILSSQPCLVSSTL